MSDALAQILSSESRFKVLKCLFGFAGAMPLRHIEKATGLKIRSVQLAVDALCEEGVLTRKKQDHFVLYKLSKSCLENLILSQIFQLISENEIQVRAAKYKMRAITGLKFINDSNNLIRKAAVSGFN
ncbi:MAG: hypothetical protein KDD38_07815 [Bdellovibrionales bacterium]|nr:hypothetical protein [Bdellovibrionales bacterium]